MIRAATLADVPAILDFGRTYQGEPSELRERPARDALQLAIGNGMVLISGQPIAGVMAIGRFRWAWSGEAYLADICTYARPGHLAGLARAASVIAAHVGLPLYVGATSGRAPAALARLWRRLGGVPVGIVVRIDPPLQGEGVKRVDGMP